MDINDKEQYSISKEELGKRLKAFRKEKGLTQQELSDAIGMKRSAYAYYETGKSEPSITTFARLADALGVSCDEIVGRTTSICESGEIFETNNLSFVTMYEKELVNLSRNLTDDQRNQLLDFIKFISKDN